MVYSNNTAILSLRGRRHGHIRIASGVKQGCPASMFFFFRFCREPSIGMDSGVARLFAGADPSICRRLRLWS
eukprot:2331299-Pyramimonas_sp.AAC.1